MVDNFLIELSRSCNEEENGVKTLGKVKRFISSRNNMVKVNLLMTNHQQNISWWQNYSIILIVKHLTADTEGVSSHPQM